MHEFERRYQGKTKCDRTGCDGMGDYRAPKSHDVLNDYYWFCLDHIREYNKQWSYNAGKTAEEIENEIRSDVLGGRPTWNRHDGMAGAKIHKGHYDDPLGAFSQNMGGRYQDIGGGDYHDGAMDMPDMPQDVRHAYAVLGVSSDCTLDDLKATYKKKAKQYHPDLNKNDAQAEEQFKTINQAYNTIMGYLS